MVTQECVSTGQLVAMVQHPRCDFAYWRLTEHDLSRLERMLDCRRHSLSFVLRVYRLGGSDEGDADGFHTIPVDMSQGKHYVYPVTPGRLYWLELGVDAGAKGFIRLLRSEIVETPPVSPAGELAEECLDTYSPFCGLV